LVNLTCGRNPWKRASIEDSTFRAYLKDPFFLKSILPLSNEMIFVLSRIFECDPSKRITIPELRRLILDCPRFTVSPWVPNNGRQPAEFANKPQLPMPVPVEPLNAQPSDSSSNSSHYSTFSNSAISDASSLTDVDSDVESMTSVSSAGLEPEATPKDTKYVVSPAEPGPCDSIECSDYTVQPLVLNRPLASPVSVC
jgi:hypothetical protein